MIFININNTFRYCPTVAHIKIGKGVTKAKWQLSGTHLLLIEFNSFVHTKDNIFIQFTIIDNKIKLILC